MTTESAREREILKFLDALCIDWGFCIAKEKAAQIVEKGSMTAEVFSREVLLAEGFVPEQELEWYRRIRNRFIERFGGEY